MSNSEATTPKAPPTTNSKDNQHGTLDSSVAEPFKYKKYDFERHKATDHEGIKVFKCNNCDYETAEKKKLSLVQARVFMTKNVNGSIGNRPRDKRTY